MSIHSLCALQWMRRLCPYLKPLGNKNRCICISGHILSSLRIHLPEQPRIEMFFENFLLLPEIQPSRI